MKEEQAVALAQEALIWMADRPGVLEAFLGASGAAPAQLGARARDPEFLGFVLDFLLQSDALVLEFAQDHDMAPERPARARAALPGSYAPDWT